MYSGSVNTSIAISDAELGSVNLFSTPGTNKALSRMTASSGFVYAVLSHGLGGSDVSVTSTNPIGAVVDYSIALSYPFYSCGLFPTTNGMATVTFTWTGAPTNSVSVWAFRL